MTIEWNDRYEVGHAEMDADHKELFERINELLAVSDAVSLMRCAMALRQHAQAHFAQEEAVMRGVNYPRLDLHIREHSYLLSELNEVTACVAQNTLKQDELEYFLFDWLLNHINTWDTDLATYATAP
jgi:hemerythrin-like metal-binding protein